LCLKLLITKVNVTELVTKRNLFGYDNLCSGTSGAYEQSPEVLSAKLDRTLRAKPGFARLPKHLDAFAFYRPQAEFSDGANDGKIGMARHDIIVFQMLTSAGDN